VIRYLLLPVLNFVMSGVLTYCLNWLAAIPWRKASAVHWTERARLLWPVRVAGGVHILLVPACLSLAEFDARLVSFLGSVIPAVAGWLGGILATFPLDREILPRFIFRSWLRLVIRSWAIRAGFLGVLVACTILMPAEPSLAMIGISGGLLVYIISLHFGSYMWLLRRLGMLLPPGERLRGIVARTVERMAVREPVTWLLDMPMAQAFAMPNTGELMFSSRLLEIESDEEISAICAHELAHLMESRGVRAGHIAGSLTLYPVIFLRPAATFGPSAVCAIVGLVWLSAIFTRKLSRRMEKKADKIAAENQGEAGVYAHALERLYSDSLVPAVSSKNDKMHPHLYDRMLAAGIQPEYPRPSKPEKMAWSGYVVCIAFGILIGIALANL
jgi:Zn-dependent protease with chaperone function